MDTILRRTAACIVLVSLFAAVPVAAQGNATQPAVTLQATGTFARGGEFTGTVTINRFEQRGNRIVAIGFVRGALHRGGQTVGTALAGEVAWPVVVSSGGLSAASGPSSPAPQFMRVAASHVRAEGRIRAVQAQEVCPVLAIALAPVDVNLLGAQVALGAITFNLQGEAGTPLGDLVCAASDLLGNVAGLVNLLNSVLSLVTGLLGGLLGGLGGVLPGAVPGIG